MQSLAIDREIFMMAFGRDVDYHDMVPPADLARLAHGRSPLALRA